ncbi:class I SAM-dependent methyltransferase [Halocatena marina]|uniref:Class I SAM-dependent methyltransferase n=1 Tax=Halocatena marina TaxID=2934937 RepID=A0ABD5YIJ9_9EURY|nr:class I SAM-dependent methyltransferase [Halocatena marina]
MDSADEPTAQDAYDELAEEYAARVDEKPYNADLDFPAMTSLVPNVDGKRVLDAGCGSGRYSEWLLDRGADVLAVDASEEMVHHARERVGNRAHVRRADLGEPLGFAEDNEFDVIVSALVLHYVEDWRELFAEFARIVKPDGVLLCSLQHPIDDYRRLEIENYFEVERQTDTWSSFGTPVEMPFYWRPLSEVINPILEAGFQLKTITEPQPTAEFKEKRPVRYEKVMRRPTFLCLKAFR